jgi:hypothetical protein
MSPLLDRKGDVVGDPSRQAWLEKIPFVLSAPYPIDQPKEQKSAIFKAASDGTDGTEGERLSTDYHLG